MVKIHIGWITIMNIAVDLKADLREFPEIDTLRRIGREGRISMLCS
jgi:hypothetical protein